MTPPDLVRPPLPLREAFFQDRELYTQVMSAGMMARNIRAENKRSGARVDELDISEWNRLRSVRGGAIIYGGLYTGNVVEPHRRITEALQFTSLNPNRVLSCAVFEIDGYNELLLLLDKDPLQKNPLTNEGPDPATIKALQKGIVDFHTDPTDAIGTKVRVVVLDPERKLWPPPGPSLPLQDQSE